MKIYFSQYFEDNASNLSRSVKKILRGKIALLEENPNHPSLRTKKIQGQRYIFEATVTMNIRLTWQYYKDGILLRKIGEHDKTLKDP